MSISKTIKSTFGIAFGTAGCYAAGVVYGAIHRMDKTLAGRAFAITVAAKLTFDTITNLVTGGAKKNAKHYYATHLVGDVLFAAIHIVAFRHFNLMGRLGTAFFTFGAFILLLKNLDGLKKA